VPEVLPVLNHYVMVITRIRADAEANNLNSHAGYEQEAIGRVHAHANTKSMPGHMDL
jgi:hypothetical protein